MDDCKHHNPVEADVKLAVDIFSEMVHIYQAERERMSAFVTIMAVNNFQMSSGVIGGTGIMTGGDMRLNSFCYCIVEGRNEIGSTGAGPVFQAGADHANLMSGASKKYPRARLPALLIYIMGTLLLLNHRSRLER